MSLNTINLAPATLLAFYKKNLVEIEGDLPLKEQPAALKPEPHTAPAASLQYLGKNLKHITILVHYTSQVYLPEEQLNFLTNILKACQLNMGDIAIVNTAKQEVNAGMLAASLAPRQLIMFGDSKDIAGNMEHFNIKETAGIAMLSAPDLESLNKNTDTGKMLKGKLWLCLKQLFNV